LDAYPVATNANKAVMADVIKKIDNEPKMSPEVAGDLLKGLWERDLGRRIAAIGIDISQGNDKAFEKLNRLIEKSKDGIMPDDFGEPTTKDINTLLELSSNDHRFRFNIPILAKHCYGIGPGEFGVWFAPPETGKTAFAVSLACAPGGWAQQGHKVLYLGNEEKTQRTMLRAYSCFTGMKVGEIADYPDLAVERFREISDNIIMKDINGWDMARVENYINKIEPKAVLVDQGDKVTVDGTFNSGHEKLREVYTQFREVTKRQDVALMAASQASNDAKGKTVITPDMMEGSKVGKFAEADLIIGIGKFEDSQDGTVDPIRFLTVGKNKLTGWHGTLPVKLTQEISRYED
jgi:KaiC/GvpD/RAD55 family RecA-like ATPase